MGRLLYDGFLKVEEVQDEIKGKSVIRERLIVKDAVAAVMVDEKGRYGLVKQYRPAVGEYTYELVAGILDKDVSERQILIEEIEEECAIKAEDIYRIDFVHEYYMLVGFSDTVLRMYEVQVVEQESKKVDDADVEEVLWVTKEQLTEMVLNKEIKDSKTMIGYYYIMSKQL